jgi:hypothetical protein
MKKKHEEEKGRREGRREDRKALIKGAEGLS